jgi:Flp pilus assembly protein TadD
MTLASQVTRQTDRPAAIRPLDGAAVHYGSDRREDRPERRRGQAAYQAGRLDEAIEYLRAAVRHGEPDGDTLSLLALALRENGELEPAKRCYSLLAERYPNEPSGHGLSAQPPGCESSVTPST